MGSLLHLSSISRQNREMGFISSHRLPVHNNDPAVKEYAEPDGSARLACSAEVTAAGSTIER